MPFSLDAEVGAALAVMFADALPPIPAGDVDTRRKMIEELQRTIHEQTPTPADVATTDYETSAPDGATLVLRWFAKQGVSPGSAVLYTHGGGMILSNVAIYHAPLARYVSATGVPFLAVEYRYAPEYPAPTPVTDCYAGLQWLVAHAGELGADPARIAIMGDSGGGGVGASLAIYTRDQGGPPVAKQILIHPMLDDRNTTPDPELVPFATWSYDDNATVNALLRDTAGGPDVSPYGAPSRLEDFAGLPPAYIEVPDLDIFRDESLVYARRLTASGVNCELHMYATAPHSFDALLPAAVSRQAFADRHRVLSKL